MLYSVLECVRKQGAVFYGAGFTGKIAYQLFSMFQVKPVCFCDDALQKQGSEFECDGVSIPILSLDEAAARAPDAVYITTVSGGWGNQREVMQQRRNVMRNRLRDRGLWSEASDFSPLRYLFLLEGGFEALKHPVLPDETSFTPERIENMILFSSMGHSGTTLLDTLMDGHPNILNIGSFGLWAPLKELYLNHLQYLEGEELVLETARQMTPFFTSQIVSRKLIWHYVDCNGDIEEGIFISPAEFTAALGGILMARGRVSFAVLCKAIFAAYQNVIGKRYLEGQHYWAFFETHEVNCNTHTMDGFLSNEDFDRLENWVIIREPVQHVFAALQRRFQDIEENELIGRWTIEGYKNMFSGSLGSGLEKREKDCGKVIKVIRFEDVKVRMRETMEAICGWLDIPFNECLLEATFNGIKVYFPAAAVDGKKTISGRDTTAVNRRDFSKHLSSFDVFRLNLVFQNVKRAYGYDCDVPDYHAFSEECLKELYQYPFRFESWMDQGYAEAQRRGCLQPGEEAKCHGHITGMLLDYMLNVDHHELMTDMILPDNHT